MKSHSPLFDESLPTVNVKRHKVVPNEISHLTSREFYDYFAVKYLISKHELCPIPVWVTWTVSKKSANLSLPINHLKTCWKSKMRFISIPLCLMHQDDTHAGTLLVDKRSGTIERFEPYGAIAYKMFKQFKYHELDKALMKEFNVLWGLTYISPDTFSPNFGPQYFETYLDETGYCATWSLWYIDLRLTYPDMPREKLSHKMYTKLYTLLNKKELETYLVNYAKQVYSFMLIEFPEYRDFFIHFDTYRYLSTSQRRCSGFEDFLHHMNRLTSIPIDGRVSRDFPFRRAPKPVLRSRIRR